MKALIVDDDLALADVVCFTMRRAGYQVVMANDGLCALERWLVERPDIIILDLNLPKLGGLAICQRIRAESETPIIILSVRGDEDDIVRGLALGADDYIVKPFSPRQLVARVEAVLRRATSGPTTPEPITESGLTLDPARGEVRKDRNRPVRLTPLECRLLEMLMRNAGNVLPADDLIAHVWGPEGGDRTMLKQLVYRLRRKIEPDPAQPQLLMNLPGIGYGFERALRRAAGG
jgi:DNA-binding response OmpR family regulator